MPSATASISRQSSKIIICFPKQGKSRSRRPVTRQRAFSQRHVSARSRLQKPSPVRASHTNARPFQFELNQTIVHRRLDAGKHRKLICTCTCHSIPGEYKSRFADGVARHDDDPTSAARAACLKVRLILITPQHTTFGCLSWTI